MNLHCIPNLYPFVYCICALTVFCFYYWICYLSEWVALYIYTRSSSKKGCPTSFKMQNWFLIIWDERGEGTKMWSIKYEDIFYIWQLKINFNFNSLADLMVKNQFRILKHMRCPSFEPGCIYKYTHTHTWDFKQKRFFFSDLRH